MKTKEAIKTVSYEEARALEIKRWLRKPETAETSIELAEWLSGRGYPGLSFMAHQPSEEIVLGLDWKKETGFPTENRPLVEALADRCAKALSLLVGKRGPGKLLPEGWSFEALLELFALCGYLEYSAVLGPPLYASYQWLYNDPDEGNEAMRFALTQALARNQTDDRLFAEWLAVVHGESSLVLRETIYGGFMGGILALFAGLVSTKPTVGLENAIIKLIVGLVESIEKGLDDQKQMETTLKVMLRRASLEDRFSAQPEELRDALGATRDALALKGLIWAARIVDRFLPRDLQVQEVAAQMAEAMHVNLEDDLFVEFADFRLSHYIGGMIRNAVYTILSTRAYVEGARTPIRHAEARTPTHHPRSAQQVAELVGAGP